jgi:PEP-CTERM motif-containing protein
MSSNVFSAPRAASSHKTGGSIMRKPYLLAVAALAATAFSATPAQATATLVSSSTGNACTGAGGINNCIATQTGVVQGTTTDPLASALIARIDSSAGTDISTLFPTIDGTEFAINFDATANTLSFTYTPGAGDPAIHYYGISQANTYDLFYDPSAITSGTINLSDLFPNNPGWSHIDFFDTGTSSVPEPGTWAMMILGFGAAGVAFRRRRRTAVLPQIA